MEEQYFAVLAELAAIKNAAERAEQIEQTAVVMELDSDQLNRDIKYFGFLGSVSEHLDEQTRDDMLKEMSTTWQKEPDQVREDFNNYIEFALRAKVRAFQNAKTPFAQKRLKAGTASWLGRFVLNKDVEGLLAAYSEENKQAEVFTVAQLLAMRSRTTSHYLVKGLLPLGDLVMVAASPKTGKSLLATSLAVTIAIGDQLGKSTFLNRLVEHGNVLVIQNEENVTTTTADRIKGHGLQNLELDNPELYQQLISSNKLRVGRDFDLILDRDKILEEVTQHNIKLVIVDSLTASIKRSGLTEYSPETVGALYTLQAMAQRHNFTVLVVHHATKMDAASTDKTKVIGRTAGNNGLVRANSGLWMLVVDKDNEAQIVLKTVMRQETPLTATLKLVQEENLFWDFEIVKESLMSDEALEQQNRILFLLRDRWREWAAEWGEVNPEEYDVPRAYGYSIGELMDLTGYARTDVIMRLNEMLRTEGIVSYPLRKKDTNYKAHVYALPTSGESWLLTYLEISEEQQQLDKVKQDEKKKYFAAIAKLAEEVIALSQANDTENLRQFIGALSGDERRDVQSKLTPDQRAQVLLVLHPPQFAVGTKVEIKPEYLPEGVTAARHVISRVVYKSESGHFYYMQGDNMRNLPFMQEHFTVYEDICKSDNGGDLSTLPE